MADPIELTQRAVEAFNRDFAEGGSDSSDELRPFLVEEPVIVPMRAALEGTRYSGPDALDQFRSASGESWRQLCVEAEEVRRLDDQTVVLCGTLVAVGRETGAETRANLAWLFEFDDDRIKSFRTFSSARDAMEAARR